MQWYEGGIAEAVTLSRTKSAIFVVYIEGKDEKSTQFTKIINDQNVSEVLGSDSFVAIKVEADSLPHKQFSEIYKQTPTPSIYFIGKNGAPIEIITDAPDSPTIVDKINNILVKSGGSAVKTKTINLLQAEASASNSAAAQAAPAEASAVPAEAPVSIKQEEPESPSKTVCDGDACETSQAPNSDIICDGNVCYKSNEKAAEKVEEDTAGNGEVVLSPEEKLKLAQELIEKKRAMKKAEEEEKEKSKEIERRKMGHDVQKMKRWQQDQEIKQRMEEREKEKREEKEAREKVRRQIEEDKREKAARLAETNATIQTQSEPQRVVKPLNSNSARLQFRLPDGSSHTHDFDSNLPLCDVITYIKTNISLNFTNFVLSTTFPRREFSANDASQTLLDLQLVPNAVVLVLPVSHGTVATNNDAGFMGMVWYFLTPIIYLFGYLKGLFFKKSENNATNNKRPVVPTEAEEQSKPVPKRRAGDAAIRRQGNIHRLTDKDSDDENNTWNGNSTQQM